MAEKEPLSFQDEKIEEIAQKLQSEVREQNESEKVFDRVNGEAASTDSAQPAAAAPKAPSAPGEITQAPAASAPVTQTPPIAIPQMEIKNLRTYQGDVASIIKEKNASVLTIAMAEKRKDQRQGGDGSIRVARSEKSGNAITIIMSSLLIILGIGIVAGLFFLQQRTPESRRADLPENPIVGFNELVSYSTGRATRNALIEIMQNQRNEANLVDNEILYTRFVDIVDGEERVLPTSELFSILNTRIPGILLRSFGERFMMGIYHFGENIPFLLVDIPTFDNAFAGMLEWEETMYADLGELLGKQSIAPQPRADTTATTTNTTPSAPVQVASIDREFEDLTVRNKDARVLRNSRGEIVLLYSFIDRETLLITHSENVLREMVNKLIATKLIR